MPLKGCREFVCPLEDREAREGALQDVAFLACRACRSFSPMPVSLAILLRLARSLGDQRSPGGNLELLAVFPGSCLVFAL